MYTETVGIQTVVGGILQSANLSLAETVGDRAKNTEKARKKKV
jgi:hypothetical protein